MTNERATIVELLREPMQKLGASQETGWIADFIAGQKLKPEAQIKLAREILERRQRHEPLAYIFGSWAFRSYEIAVGPGVLIPRPETEELVECVLKAVENSGESTQRLWKQGMHVADLGAGSGCIGLALMADLLRDTAMEGLKADEVGARCQLSFVEQSAQALPYLKRNIDAFRALLHGCKVDVIEKSWSQAKFAPASLDLLLSNPPYVTEAEYAQIEPSVSDYEPKTSLVPADIGKFPDASGPYREILGIAQSALRSGGWVWFEMGGAQVEWIKDYADSLGSFNDLRVVVDMADKSRFFGAKKA